ncbi:hypothetical protein CC85DRAFT_287928 [Cutaneotrichosporon oleaginosum]|uniref:DUF567-domain-containing protein n=1 Tax=Cutaneotrichosporon oleaginosum TaxID=879819 RepID=A0A0J0XG40_9TREE|nr:uncharacterized protein CC85DRAFT_287928 [Cutaneotrichosporon oleaginosum]KLT40043.1 hypothetical protein CC85DRAFT_287928 [Cutaneotrichosporon oleaginosum]TXT13814.1 hypothetical protein COLE_00007 [Cutaneotrichosporon oleaginosum]
MSAPVFETNLPPLALFGRHMHTTPATLFVADELFRAGDDYVVKDANGAAILRADAREWSRLEKKVVYDDELQLGEIRDALALHRTVEFVGGAGTPLKVEHRRSEVGGREAAFRVDLGKLTLAVVGDWKAHAVDIVSEDGGLVARVTHDRATLHEGMYVTSQGKTKIGEAAETQYKVEVAPRVDLSLIGIVCICLDMLQQKVC